MTRQAHDPTFEPIKGWQCIGCGKVEAPQNCIGVCQDRRVDLVYADQLTDALADNAALQQRIEALESFLRQLALTTPRDAAWERSYRAFQQRARALLAVAPSP